MRATSPITQQVSGTQRFKCVFALLVWFVLFVFFFGGAGREGSKTVVIIRVSTVVQTRKLRKKKACTVKTLWVEVKITHLNEFKSDGKI